MISFLLMLGGACLAFAQDASTHLPAGLYKQLPKIADQPLMGNPVTIFRQFLPAGTYHVRLDNGREETLEVQNDVLRLRVGAAFDLHCHYPIYQPTGGVMYGSGRTVVRKVADGWMLTHDFHHRAPVSDSQRARNRNEPLFLKFQLHINAKHDVTALTWDTANLIGPRRRGSLRFLRKRPPPSRRCDLLTVLPYPD